MAQTGATMRLIYGAGFLLLGVVFLITTIFDPDMPSLLARVIVFVTGIGLVYVGAKICGIWGSYEGIGLSRSLPPAMSAIVRSPWFWMSLLVAALILLNWRMFL